MQGAGQQAVTVHGNQHYLQANHVLTCSCAPIFNPHGQVVGALDISGDHRSYHQHTLALVRMSAQMIENHMFAGSFPKAVRIHFHARPEFLGTLVEGIAVFSPEGRFLSANRSAQFQLGLPFSALQAHTFSSLFDLPISALLELFSGTGAPKQLHLHSGVAVWCKVDVRPANPWSAPAFSDHNPPSTRKPQAQHLSSLQYLDTGDVQISSVIHKLRKVVDKDIPVMILGETGTGKDLLAQAFHNDSARARQPFVAVNCASIPEALIESELFGYEEGAFTGARKKGATGKIAQAHGGTLVLDEIGDMPKHLQARLLRVLQERRISPLGAGKEIEVDVAVVCATHKNLKELIARGDFREDLYYRLNVIEIVIPPLRERREDLPALCTTLLARISQESGMPVPRLNEAALQAIASHPLTGNVRELENLLHRAVALSEGDELQVEWQGDAPSPSPSPSPSHTPRIEATPEANTHSAQHSPSDALPLPNDLQAWLDQQERDILVRALKESGFNRTATAARLGISLRQIRYRIPRLNIAVPNDQDFLDEIG